MLELTGDQGIEFRRMRHVPFGQKYGEMSFCES